MSSGFAHESTANKSFEWYTPKYIFDALGLHFDLDPCSPGAGKSFVPATRHLTIEDDGLATPWPKGDLVWMNPPYGLGLPPWVAKLAEHGEGIALVFARLDTRWAQAALPKASAVCFIGGRLQFIDGTTGEPMDNCGAGSMLVAFGDRCAEALRKSGLGMVFAPDALARPADPSVRPEKVWKPRDRRKKKEVVSELLAAHS